MPLLSTDLVIYSGDCRFTEEQFMILEFDCIKINIANTRGVLLPSILPALIGSLFSFLYDGLILIQEL